MSFNFIDYGKEAYHIISNKKIVCYFLTILVTKCMAKILLISCRVSQKMLISQF